MSDIAVKVFYIPESVLKVLTCVSVTVWMFSKAAVARRPPFPEPSSESNGSDSKDDNDRDSSIFKSISIKDLICFLALFIVIMIIVVVGIVCWKCASRGGYKRWKRFLSRAEHLPSHGACAICMRSGDLGSRERGLENPGCSVETVYDPRQFCACSAHAHHCHHAGWPMNCRDRRTPPPSYPIRNGHSVSDVPGRSEEEGPGHADHLVPRSFGPLETQNPLQQTFGPASTAILPVRSHVNNNNVTTDSDDDNNDQLGLVPSHTSNQATHTAIYSRYDDNIVMIGSHTASGTQLYSGTGPMNIECPGLFDTFPPSLRDLFVPGERSERRTVAGKLVVSLARLVDSRGDLLVLDNMGISLQVPPGAIASGQRQLVSLVLNWDLGDNPPMDNTQALVSPVVYCGPHGLKLLKPCVLSFKHCAFDPRIVQVLSSQTELVEQKDWQLMCSAEDSSGMVSMATDECQVRLQHFSLFTCIQTPPSGTTGKKWLQVAAFCAPLQHQVHHYQVRVYFLNKTPCALQWAIQNEARFGFRLACPERTFLFQGSGESLHLTVNYVSRGWGTVKENCGGGGGGEEEEGGTVPYHSVWHGKCPHLSFCFKRSCIQDNLPYPYSHHSNSSSTSGVTSDTSFPAKVMPHVSEINLDLAVFQDSSSNTPDHLNLLLTEVPSTHLAGSTLSSASIPGCAPTHLLPACDKHPINISMPPMTVSSGKITGKVRIDPQATGHNVLVDFEQDVDCLPWPFFASSEGAELNTGGANGGGAKEQGEEVYPQDLKLKLKLKLDPPCTFGKDWKLLASRLGLDKYIRWLTYRDSPTLHVLQYMEMKGISLSCLHFLLTEIDRYDAAGDVQNVIDKRHTVTSNDRHGQENWQSSDVQNG